MNNGASSNLLQSPKSRVSQITDFLEKLAPVVVLL